MNASDQADIDQEVTALIHALGGGEDQALGHLFSAAYEELCRLAHAQRRNWSGQETLSTTVLVHEAYLKLSRQNAPQWQDRAHFFRVAARAMRHILINYAERSRTAKRGGADAHPVSSEDATLVDESRAESLLALDQALTRLTRQHPRWARVVECRVFGGLDVEETAEALAISPRTVKRDWQRGQTWIYRHLEPD